MTDTPLLAIIVPHYNHKNCLPSFLDSVLQQQIKRLEVIIVDDGSTESCGDIVHAYRNNGLRITLLENGTRLGTKNARLAGIKAASAPVLAFADADDALYGTTVLETYTHAMLDYQLDILHFNAIHHDTETNSQQVVPWNAPFAPSLYGKDIFAAFLRTPRAWHMWNKLYSRDLCLQHIDTCHTSAITWAAEDIFLTLWLFYHAKRYRGREEPGYLHHIHYAETRLQRAAARMIAMFHIEQEFIPYMKTTNSPTHHLNLCQQFIVHHFFELFIPFQTAVFTHPVQLPADVCHQLTASADQQKLQQALTFFIQQTDFHPSQSERTVQQMQSVIALLRQCCKE